MATQLNILLLLDSPQSTENILAMLDGVGFVANYKLVSTKADFLTHLNFSWDVMIADYSFSDLDVLEALQRVQAQGLNVPFVIVNGTDSASIAVKCIKAGAADYLPKDELVRLPQVIKQTLAKKTQLLELHKYKKDLEQRLQAQTAELTRQEDRSQQVEAALQRIEAQLQTLIAKNADGIVVVDRQGIVRFINPAALKLFGRKQEELLGELFGFPVVGSDNTEVDIYPHNAESAAAGGSLEKIAQMRVVEIEWQTETAYLVSLRDITERKRVEEERNKLLEQAQVANRIKDEFLSVLSHEPDETSQ